jgi:hypothetical protein
VEKFKMAGEKLPNPPNCKLTLIILFLSNKTNFYPLLLKLVTFKTKINLNMKRFAGMPVD